MTRLMVQETAIDWGPFRGNQSHEAARTPRAQKQPIRTVRAARNVRVRGIHLPANCQQNKTLKAVFPFRLTGRQMPVPYESGICPE
jgi:hypothetical protein